MADNGATIYRFFRGKGLSPAQDAGILGNTQQESGNDPNAPGGGLIQGQGGRTSSGTLQQQLEGVWRELNGPERGTLQALRGAHDPRTAARIFSQRFERPGVPMLGNRESYAVQALQRYAHLSPATAQQLAGGGAGGRPGAPARSGAGPGGGLGVSAAQVEDLMALMDGGGKGGPSTSVEGLAVPKPQTGAGPRVPQELPQEPSPAPSDLLGLIAKLGEDAPQGEAPSAAGLPARAAVRGEAASAGGAVSPPGPGAYGALAGRGLQYAGPDQGVDFTGAGELRAPADVRITRVASNTGWSGEGNIVVGRIVSGPEAGRYMYLAEDLRPGPGVREGAIIRRGAVLAHATGSGRAPGVEVGFAQDAHGSAYGTTNEGKPGGPSPVHGLEFARYLQRVRRGR